MDELLKLSIEELIKLRDAGENVQYLIDRKIHERFIQGQKVNKTNKNKNGK